MHQPIRRVLQANALFSFATGLLLVTAPGKVSGWLGLNVDGWFRLLGVGLVGHCALLWLAQTRTDPRPFAKLNLMSIAPYPLMMVGVIAFNLVGRNLGKALVLTDGLVVGIIAWEHWRKLKAPSTAPVSTMS